MADLIQDVGTVVPAVSPEVIPVVAPVTPIVAAQSVQSVTPEVVVPVVIPSTAEELLKNNPELQAYLNKITGDARKEGREKGKKDVLDSAGVDDPAKIKALFDAEKARQEAEMTATQRLQTQLDAALAEKQTFAAQVAATQEQMRNTLLKGEIDKQATALNFIDVFDLKSRLDSATIEIDLETGNVTGVSEQAKSIAANAKHLIKQPTPVVTPNVPTTHVPATPKPASAQAQSTVNDEEKRRKAWKPR